MVVCYKDDLLIEVFYQMKQKRVSVIPIEDKNVVQTKSVGGEVQSYTVGLIFLADLLYLFRLPNCWDFLSQPVYLFLEEMYGIDYDSVSHNQSSLSNSVYGAGYQGQQDNHMIEINNDQASIASE